MGTKRDEDIEDIINYFAISLFGQNTVDDILWDLTKNCISKLGFEDCVIYLLDHNRNVLVQKAAHGPKNPKDFTIHQPIEIPLGKGIVGHVAQYGQPEIVPNTVLDSRYIKDDVFRYSEITVPISLHGQVIGVIDAEHSERNFFNERHLKILTLIASLCANKIMFARAEEQMRQEQAARFEAQRKLSEFQLQALRSNMNPHFVFNALNAIQYFITANKGEHAMRYLSLFAKFIRKSITASSQVLVPLQDELMMLSTFLDLEKLRFQDRLMHTLTVDAVLNMHAWRIPGMVIQSYVTFVLRPEVAENMRRHVSIDLHIEGNHLMCRINSNIKETMKQDSTTAKDWQEFMHRVELLNQGYNTGIQISFYGKFTEMRLPLSRAHD